MCRRPHRATRHCILFPHTTLFRSGPFKSGALSGGAMAVAFVYFVAVLVFFLLLQVRLSVAGPVMAHKLTRNPVTGLTESWKLTGASQWAIVGDRKSVV